MHQLFKWTDHIEAAILTVSMAVMTIAVAVQVFCRYVIAMPLDWSEELARFSFIWCIYMGVSYACINRKHLKIDASLFLFPRAWRPWVEFLGKVLFLLFAAVLVYVSWNHLYRITFVREQLSPAMRIPMGVAYGAIPLSFAMVIIRLLQDMSKFFRNREYLDTDVLSRIAKDEMGDVAPVEPVNTKNKSD